MAFFTATTNPLLVSSPLQAESTVIQFTSCCSLKVNRFPEAIDQTLSKHVVVDVQHEPHCSCCFTGATAFRGSVHNNHKWSADMLEFPSASGHLTHCRGYTRCTGRRGISHIPCAAPQTVLSTTRERDQCSERGSISMVALLDTVFALRVSQEFFTFLCSVPASVPFPTVRTPWSGPVSHGEDARRAQLKQGLICLNGGRHGLLLTRCYCRNVH